jgi:murein L,D-transpeptidase YcbB/YkuD
MGGQALIARFRAAGTVFLLALLVAGSAFMKGLPARAEPTDLAAIDATAPASTEAESPGPAELAPGAEAFSEPAAAGDDQSLSPAPPPEGEDIRDPADADGTTEKPTNNTGTPPADTAAPTPGESPAQPVDAGGTPSAPAVASEPQQSANPIVASIRLKLQEPGLRKGAASADLSALEAFYAEHQGAPLWITTVGFSSKAQAIIAEIQKADEWGLPGDAFDLPPAADLPSTTEAQAVDEIKLALAVLKYARFARGGRVSPSRISSLFDQKSNLLDPKTVLVETAAAVVPGDYLRSLHPKHDQFERLRQAFLKAAANARARGRKPTSDGTVQRLIVNMERWRWMPTELGSYYVWNNIPAFTTRVVKGGKSIYVGKTIVGQLKYATPIFSADMRSIVFNPEWVVPETIKTEDLQPRLRQIVRGEPDVSVLRDNKLSVSYAGRPIDATTIDWEKVNIHRYTFTQSPGPDNVLGALKFNFPNRHAVYMHDTVQPALFGQTVRTLSHGCIRVHEPEKLAALLLAEDKGWSAAQVKSMLAKGNNSGVVLNRPMPVHLSYFTLAFDGVGKLQTYADVYGLDTKMATVLFGRAEPIAAEAAPAQKPQRKRSASTGGAGRNSVIPGLFGN